MSHLDLLITTQCFSWDITVSRDNFILLLIKSHHSKEYTVFYWRLPRWCSGKESTYQCRRHRIWGFDPWVRKIPWMRKWQLVPVFLPGKTHGQRSMVNYSPYSCKELDMTEHACMYFIDLKLPLHLRCPIIFTEDVSN